MTNAVNILEDFQAGVTQGLLKAAELAREEAIRTNTGIVVAENGKIVTISAAELKVQKHKEQSDT